MSEMIKSHLETRECRLQGVLRKLLLLRDGPLENLWGGGGRAKYKKKKFAQGKIKRKKIRARQLTLENIHATA